MGAPKGCIHDTGAKTSGPLAPKRLRSKQRKPLRCPTEEDSTDGRIHQGHLTLLLPLSDFFQDLFCSQQPTQPSPPFCVSLEQSCEIFTTVTVRCRGKGSCGWEDGSHAGPPVGPTANSEVAVHIPSEVCEVLDESHFEHLFYC